jgi:hypothetical protein
MVFFATLNNISVISWRSVLLVEEAGVHGENHRPVASHWQTLSHKVVSSTPRLGGIWSHNISGDKHRLPRYSCKSNYHAITARTAPYYVWQNSSQLNYNLHKPIQLVLYLKEIKLFFKLRKSRSWMLRLNKHPLIFNFQRNASEMLRRSKTINCLIKIILENIK